MFVYSITALSRTRYTKMCFDWMNGWLVGLLLWLSYRINRHVQMICQEFSCVGLPKAVLLHLMDVSKSMIKLWRYVRMLNITWWNACKLYVHISVAIYYTVIIRVIIIQVGRWCNVHATLCHQTPLWRHTVAQRRQSHDHSTQHRQFLFILNRNPTHIWTL